MELLLRVKEEGDIRTTQMTREHEKEHISFVSSVDGKKDHVDHFFLGLFSFSIILSPTLNVIF